ncbi:hypothetical protein [Methylobacterium bullatum]|uniref:hypothetical protein n=1 Tax=Methylobacterium bullatum TaxID=570505 RepID=UPI0030CDF2AF
MAFNPNQKTLAACIAEIKNMQSSRGYKINSIFTSKDVKDIWNDKELNVSNVPGGFNKIMLPFFLDGGATFYVSAAGPNVKVPKHSHDEGAGVRFIVSGSILYNGIELVEGDWMFLPAGSPYEFDVGPHGVTMFYCYQCCCA